MHASKAWQATPNCPFPYLFLQSIRPVSWSELREMSDSGLVEIGSHTATHPILASIADEESRQELILSKAEIEDDVEREVRSFCFPNGMPGDFRPGHVRQKDGNRPVTGPRGSKRSAHMVFRGPAKKTCGNFVRATTCCQPAWDWVALQAARCSSSES